MLPLRTFVEPDVVRHRVGVLVLLDLDGPEALDPLALVIVGADLGDAQSEERKREELEGVLRGGAVRHRREELILRRGFLVLGRFKRTDGPFN